MLTVLTQTSAFCFGEHWTLKSIIVRRIEIGERHHSLKM